MNHQELNDHVFDTYLSLRAGMALIAFGFPLVVVASGFFLDTQLPLQPSLSAYYWASNTGFNPARIPFVGGLCALGAFLYLYKGFTPKENIALNLAAVCAVGVACFPMAWTCQGCGGWTPHGSFAVGLFACLVYVVWFRSSDTLPFLPPEHSPKKFAARYAVLGLAMALAPVAALTINWAMGAKWFVVLVETFGIWAFAAYWYYKTKELKLSRATRMALANALPDSLEAMPSLRQILTKGPQAPR